MQRTTTKWLMVLAIISIAFTYFMFYSNTEDAQESQIDKSISIEIQKQPTESKSKIVFQTDSSFQLKEQCDNDKIKNIKEFAHPKWLSFRKDIYAQGIRFPVLQLALNNSKPIMLHPLLHRKLDSKSKSKSIPKIKKILNDLSEEEQFKIFGALLSEGITGLSDRVETGEFPSEIFSESPRDLYKIIVEMPFNTASNRLLPNEEELLLLTGHGLEISIDDYNKATEINAPQEYLALLITFGPTPDSQNNLHAKIPIDIAADKSNLKLIDFWINTGFTSNNKLYGGDFSDTLLLNASSSEQFKQAWGFLQSRSKTPVDPNTAKILLESRGFLIDANIRYILSQLATTIPSLSKLSEIDHSIYQTALSDIIAINQSIQNKFPDHKQCNNITNKKLITDLLNKKWVLSQLQQGKTIEDIFKILAKVSPTQVDSFRAHFNQGYYEPQLKPMPGKEFEIIDSNTRQILGLLLLKDWDSIKTKLNEDSITDRALLTLLSDNSKFKIPAEIVDTIYQKISTIPLGGYNIAAKKLSIDKLEQMELNSVALNQLDESGKNLFYYATKNNNIELMHWLLDKNVEMDPDKYGSDPLDAALRWNTHPETLQTLCNLDFPIKNKHKKRFEEIQNDDPDESIEILERCPGFGE